MFVADVLTRRKTLRRWARPDQHDRPDVSSLPALLLSAANGEEQAASNACVARCAETGVLRPACLLTPRAVRTARGRYCRRTARRRRLAGEIKLAGEKRGERNGAPGSTTSFNSWNAKATARATSASFAVTPSATSVRLTSKVSFPGVWPSRRRRCTGQRGIALAPAAAERAGVIVESLRLRRIMRAAAPAP